MRVFGAFFVLFGVLLSLTSCSKQESLIVSEVQVREAPPGRTMTAAYLTITNATDSAVVLNYVHAEGLEEIEIHRHLYADGKMQMREIAHADIGPGETLKFEPHGYHLMLFGIDEKFEEGYEFPVTFEFSGNEKRTVKAVVKRL